MREINYNQAFEHYMMDVPVYWQSSYDYQWWQIESLLELQEFGKDCKYGVLEVEND